MEQVTTYNTKTLETIMGDLGLPVLFSHMDIGCSSIYYHFNLCNPREVNKIKKTAECLSALIHKEVEVRKSDSASFCYGIARDKRDFPMFFRYHTALEGKEPGEILFGIDEKGNPITKNIREVKSMLIGGSSGGGKSVCLSNILCSLICYSKPEECGLALIDLKRVEFKLFENADHLVRPVQYDYQGALKMLKDIKATVEKRYIKMQQQNIRKATVDKFPLLVVVIDEYAELSRHSNRGELDNIVSSIASTGRACNVFIIVATQHAVSSVISNTIKSNLQSRIGLKTTNLAQSVCIIGTKDCKSLLGYGDSYMQFDGVPGLHRIQVCNLTDDNINTILKVQNDRAIEKASKKPVLSPIKRFFGRIFGKHTYGKQKGLNSLSVDDLNDFDCMEDDE